MLVRLVYRRDHFQMIYKNNSTNILIKFYRDKCNLLCFDFISPILLFNSWDLNLGALNKTLITVPFFLMRKKLLNEKKRRIRNTS